MAWILFRPSGSSSRLVTVMVKVKGCGKGSGGAGGAGEAVTGVTVMLENGRRLSSAGGGGYSRVGMLQMFTLIGVSFRSMG